MKEVHARLPRRGRLSPPPSEAPTNPPWRVQVGPTPLEQARAKIDFRAVDAINWFAGAGLCFQRIPTTHWASEGRSPVFSRHGGLGDRQRERELGAVFREGMRWFLNHEQKRLLAMLVAAPETESDATIYTLQDIAAEMNGHFRDQRGRFFYAICAIQDLGHALDHFRRTHGEMLHAVERVRRQLEELQEQADRQGGGRWQASR